MTPLPRDALRPREVSVCIILFLGGFFFFFFFKKDKLKRDAHVLESWLSWDFIETDRDETDWESGMRAGQRVRPWSDRWKSEMTPRNVGSARSLLVLLRGCSGFCLGRVMTPEGRGRLAEFCPPGLPGHRNSPRCSTAQQKSTELLPGLLLLARINL